MVAYLLLLSIEVFHSPITFNTKKRAWFFCITINLYITLLSKLYKVICE